MSLEAVPEVAHYLKVFVAVFILVNPFEGIPFFLTATESMPPEGRDRVARRAALGVTIILLASLVAGRLILAAFGITTAAFQTAGGVIIFLIGLKMVFSSPDAGASRVIVAPHRDIAIVPLATPLLAGPGPISSVILYASHGPTVLNHVVLALIIVLVGAATLLSLRLAVPLARLLKETGVDIASRMMGLLVTAIALEIIVTGATKLVPLLGR
jgi:multiple antibiotic resistance protein